MSEEFELASRDMEGDPVFRAKELRRHSLDWLRKAWGALDDEKELERIRGKAKHHLARVKSYRWPENSDAYDHWLEALELAWHACWMTFGLSFGTTYRQDPKRLNGLLQFTRNESAYWVDKTGRYWSRIAAPKYYPDGSLTDVPNDKNTLSKWRASHGYSYLIVRTGADVIVPAGATEWAFFADRCTPVSNDPAVTLRDCFFADYVEARAVKYSLNCIFERAAKLHTGGHQTAGISTSYFCGGLHVVGGNGPIDKIMGVRRLEFSPDRNSSAARVPRLVAPNLEQFRASNLQKASEIELDKATQVDISGQSERLIVRGDQIDVLNIGVEGPSAHVEARAINELSIKVSRLSANICVEELGIAVLEVGGIGRLSFEGRTAASIRLLSIGNDRLNAEEAVFDIHSVSELISENIEFQNVSATKVSFGAVRFKNPNVLQSCDFTSCIFTKAADFSASKPQSGSLGVLRHCTFAGTTFEDGADFSNRAFAGPTDFSESIWNGVPRFHGSQLNADTNFRGVNFNTPKSMSMNGGKKLAEFERAYRTLKLAMEELRARHDEAMFHREELVARRRQTDQVP